MLRPLPFRLWSRRRRERAWRRWIFSSPSSARFKPRRQDKEVDLHVKPRAAMNARSPGESGGASSILGCLSSTSSFSSSSTAGHLSGLIRGRRVRASFVWGWGFNLGRRSGEWGRNLSNVCTGPEGGGASVSSSAGCGGGGAEGRDRRKVCTASDAGGTWALSSSSTTSDARYLRSLGSLTSSSDACDSSSVEGFARISSCRIDTSTSSSSASGVGDHFSGEI